MSGPFDSVSRNFFFCGRAPSAAEDAPTLKFEVPPNHSHVCAITSNTLPHLRRPHEYVDDTPKVSENLRSASGEPLLASFQKKVALVVVRPRFGSVTLALNEYC